LAHSTPPANCPEEVSHAPWLFTTAHVPFGVQGKPAQFGSVQLKQWNSLAPPATPWQHPALHSASPQVLLAWKVPLQLACVESGVQVKPSEDTQQPVGWHAGSSQVALATNASLGHWSA